MKRSASITTTNTVLQVRIDKYQKALIINNVVILLLSLLGLFMGLIWIIFYHMDKLTFVDTQFHTFGWMVVGVSVASLVICFVGFIASAGELKIPLYIYAVLLSITAISWIATLFLAFTLMPRDDQKLSQRATPSKLNDFKIEMANSNDIFEAINIIESDFNCCGLKDDLEGYRWYENFRPHPDLKNDLVGELKDWNLKNGQNILDKWEEGSKITGVPRSCCLLPLKAQEKDCGKSQKNALYIEDNIKYKKFPVAMVGCLAVIDEKYLNEVKPLMFIFCFGATVMMLLQVATVALAFAHAVVINKRSNRYGFAGDNEYTTTTGL